MEQDPNANTFGTDPSSRASFYHVGKGNVLEYFDEDPSKSEMVDGISDELSMEDRLELWKLEKTQVLKPTKPLSLTNKRPSRSKVPPSSKSNQYTHIKSKIDRSTIQTVPENSQMFEMSFSPPKHHSKQFQKQPVAQKKDQSVANMKINKKRLGADTAARMNQKKKYSKWSLHTTPSNMAAAKTSSSSADSLREAKMNEKNLADELLQLEIKYDKLLEENAVYQQTEKVLVASLETKSKVEEESLHYKTEWEKSVKENEEAALFENTKFNIELTKQQKRNEKLDGLIQLTNEKVTQLNQRLTTKQAECRQYQEEIKGLKQKLDEKDNKLVQLQAQKADIQFKDDQLLQQQEYLEAAKRQLLVCQQQLEDCRVQKAEDQEKHRQNHESDLKSMELRLSQVHNTAINQLEIQLHQNETMRRKLHNKVMELRGNIRVFCRVRAVLPKEKKILPADSSVFQYPDELTHRQVIQVQASKDAHVSYRTGHTQTHTQQNGQTSHDNNKKTWAFEFDHVFGPANTQEDLFVEVSALVQSAMDGFPVCIFAYGQTGSGKTYTMQGELKNKALGLIPRAVNHLFSASEGMAKYGWQFEMSVEMVEIYNETFRDLLNTSDKENQSQKIELRVDKAGIPFITHVKEVGIQSSEEFMALRTDALSFRSTKKTFCNEYSSRSHCITTVKISGTNAVTNAVRSSVLRFIDLAGSERLSLSGSGNDPVMLKEAQAINKSLSSLGNVICALSNKERHIPFRDSKLTHFLQPSLGGDSKTLMICTLSPLPTHRQESLNSLRFAKKVNSCEIAYSSTQAKQI